jgi:formate dehydrogenase subunit beta
MQRTFDVIKKRAEELLADGTVNRVIGWKAGDTFYDPTPAVFTSAEELSELVYDSFCASSLVKYLIDATKEEGKVLVFLKPCDTYGFNALVKEHRIVRENVYAIGIECEAKLDMEKIRAAGIKGVESVEEQGDEVVCHTIYGDKTIAKADVIQGKCLACKGKEYMAFDELLVPEDTVKDAGPEDRFAEVAALEAMTPDERFAFWRSQLSKCIRCNACRNACPVCTCNTCVFDNNASGVASKANSDSFEENMFHIIRAFHVAGRCTDCGECSRVCPQNIPIHLLNRKFIKDINELYGEYQAGEDTDSKGPLTFFTFDDCEPSIVMERGGNE